MREKRFLGVGRRLLAIGMAFAVCAQIMLLSVTTAAAKEIPYSYAKSYTDEETGLPILTSAMEARKTVPRQRKT